MKKNLLLFLCAILTISAVNAMDANYDTLDALVDQQGGYDSNSSLQGEPSDDDSYSDALDSEMASYGNIETAPNDLIEGLNGTSDMYQRKLTKKMEERTKLDKQLSRLGTDHDVKKIRKKIERAQEKLDALHREENDILKHVSVYKRMAEILQRMDDVDREIIGLQSLIDGVARSQDEVQQLRD